MMALGEEAHVVPILVEVGGSHCAFDNIRSRALERRLCSIYQGFFLLATEKVPQRETVQVCLAFENRHFLSFNLF